MVPDEVYVHKTIDGDVNAFNELVARHHTKIYGLAYRMLGDAENAEDATQEAFLEAYKSIRSFQFQSKFSTWLYRVAINTCQQQIRKSDSRGRTIAAYAKDFEDRWLHYSDAPDWTVLKTERDELIQQAIHQLPPKQREAITLFYMQHLKYREIAEILDCSEGTVASRLNTAVGNLKSKLKNLQKQ